MLVLASLVPSCVFFFIPTFLNLSYLTIYINEHMGVE